MIGVFALAMAAVAGTDVVVTDGPLRPGRAATLEVAATRPNGSAETETPRVIVSGATIRGPTSIRAGVWRYAVVPAVDAATVDVRVVSASGTEVRRAFQSLPPPPSALGVPELVDGVARGEPVQFVVAGASVDALQVVPGEGTVDLEAVEGGVRVVFRPDDLPYPRWVPVAVHDAGVDSQPAWIRVRLHARPRLAMTVEPGVTLNLSVGGRAYGPFVAGDDGLLDPRVDQYPGEVAASALLVDDLGNETRSELPLLAQVDPTLVVLATGTVVPGRPPPLVYVGVIGPDGAAPARPPQCRTPSAELPSLALAPSGYVVALPPTPDQPEDLRVVCTSGGTSTAFRVDVAAGVPADLALRVWPEDLRADFPSAEVRVVLEDIRGEQMSAQGIVVDAARGEVEMLPTEGMVARGVYDGTSAVTIGEDQVRARYEAPHGDGPIEEIRLGWGSLGPDGLPIHARLLDRLRRPLPGRTVELTVGATTTTGVSGPDGWATWTSSPSPPTRDPLPILVTDGRVRASALAILADGPLSGPGAPELQQVRPVAIRPGRVTGISVDVEPPILRAGPGAIAWVYVRLEDGSGQPVLDEMPVIDVSEGTVGDLRVRSDGILVAEYAPDAIETAREVVITARTDTLRSSARLTLEPRVVRMSVGPWIGGQTNFGEVSGPIVGIDLDVRTRNRLVGEALILHFGAAGTTFRSVATTGVGPDAELRSSLVPLTGALLLRQDQGPWAVWGGAGGCLAVHRMQVRFGDELVSSGSRLLFGPTALGAVARRALGGEVTLSVQGTWLPAAQEEVGYAGNLGGIAGGLGYRVVY